MSGWVLLASAIIQYQRKIKLFNSIEARINFSNRDLKNIHIPMMTLFLKKVLLFL